MLLRLCCFPDGTGNKGIELGTSLEDIDAIIQRDALQWPKKGTLVVQVNPDSQSGKTWLPHALASTPWLVSTP